MPKPEFTSLNKKLLQDTKFSPTFKLAVWEYAYQKELEPYWELVTKKAKRIKKLEKLDFFSLPEKEAMQKTQYLNYLNDELDKMVGFKLFTENLKDAYLETSAWLADYTAYLQSTLLHDHEEMAKNYLVVSECLLAASQSERVCLKLLESIVEELGAKNISLDRLNGKKL